MEERTQIQKQIEKTVTNGLGYRDINGYVLRRLGEMRKYDFALADTELDLQMNLGVLETITAESDWRKKLLWKQVLALCEIADQFPIYPIRGMIQTPENVNSLLQNYFLRERVEAQRKKRLKITNKGDESYNCGMNILMEKISM